MTNAPEIDVAASKDFDWEAVRTYLSANVPKLTGPLRVFQFPGGFSNMTYLVLIGDTDLVLKRPPAGPRPKGAHDMRREYRMLTGLHDRYRYAPAAIAYCADESMAGADFLVMERVAGVVVRPEEIAARNITNTQLGDQLEGLIDALTSLHAVDPERALPGFGRPDGYRERQVEGWLARMEKAATPEMAEFAHIKSWLKANAPTEPARVAVVHNDFKLDNLVWREDAITSLRAVLDWEMATVGDPLMDLACTLSFWVQRDDPADFRSLRSMPSAIEGAPTRADAFERYRTASGTGAREFRFYLCFAMFRRAVIEQQKFARFRSGHSTDARYARLDLAVATLLRMAWQIANENGSAFT
jgi:aminoglycoside phosphotransferase (APT) family kinase protein